MTSPLLWWLMAEVLGLVALPVCFFLFKSLPDRGYAFSKILGLLLLGYVTWLVAELQFVDFSQATVYAFLVLLAAGSAWLIRHDWRELLDFVRLKQRLILGYEAIFLAAFGFLVWFRGFNPQIDGTEKPMDFALINGILRSGQFPPEDPWMSGFSISYYYFGYYLDALMIRLTGVMPAVGFNLALASIFGLTALAIAGLLYNLTGRLSAGVLGAFLTLLASNADGFLRVLSYRTLDPQKFWWWWDSSRVLKSGCGGQCIDEFPQFSFMLGDLHPHVMALPLAALALGLALAMLRRAEPLRWQRSEWLTLLVVPLAAGSLGFVNTWDLPVYLGIVLLAVILRQLVGPLPGASVSPGSRVEISSGAPSSSTPGPQPPAPTPRHSALTSRHSFDWRAPAWIAALAIAAYLPFYVGFQSQAGGIGLVDGQTTPQEFLGMWAIPVLLALGLLVTVIRLPDRDLMVLAIASVGIEVITRHWLVSIMLPLALAIVWHVVRQLRYREWDPDKTFVLGLTAIAFGLFAVCEVVFLKDTFNNRMNTIFKFYYEAWLLLAIAGAYSMVHISQRLKAVPAARYAWLGGSAAALVMVSLYPIASFYTKAEELKPAWTLDGSAFLATRAPGDLAGIRWLNSTVAGDPVVAEATGDEYSAFGRFGTYTGLASILGWAGHELQWRGVWKEQPKRISDLTALYSTTNTDEIKNLLRQYNVSYVVVGPLERQKYGNRDYSQFQNVGQVVFNENGTTIYRVDGQAQAGPSLVGVRSGSNG